MANGTGQFNDPPLSTADLLKLLQRRGLVVADVKTAAHYLEHIGYSRLNIYALPFLKGGKGSDRNDFRHGTTFEQVLERCNFDRKLRLLVMDALERIEISVRAILSNSIAVRHGSHWYLDNALFIPTFDHAKFLTEVQDQIGHDPKNYRRRDSHIQNYYMQYARPFMPPCWAIFQSISFGSISYALKNLEYPENEAAAQMYGLSHRVFSSWLHCLSYLRNLCAHHTLLWNRTFTLKPFVAKAFKTDLTPNHTFYAYAAIIQILLSRVAPANHWQKKLSELFAEFPSISTTSMGFPVGWEQRNIWK